MPARPTVRPIGEADVPTVAEFLHRELNPRVSVAAWEQLMRPPWSADAPNRGFALFDDAGSVVGAYAAVYSERPAPGGTIAVCNLAAFCVREDARAHGLRLIRALLAQKGYVFTDLSPSGNVVALNERLGFRRLDTATWLAPNLPSRRPAGVRLSEDPDAIAQVLTGTDASVFRDHRRAAAARHLVVQRGRDYAYVIYRRDRRKRLPLFATVLYAGGSGELLREAWPAVRTRLARHGLAATLAEPRLLGFVPSPARAIAQPRAKMVRGDGWDDAQVDYVYSELALVAW
ncbi:GNAT family N-acetyltransferase [Microbacterium sp. RD1]|uniref:GNAT family N-acetyltransferase n=1 Tax=Microbacterium sp. RD1 TaxID=3457313 RepID=UPI003FA5FA05